MKLWIDDLREPRKGFEWAQNSSAAIAILDMNRGAPLGEVSFDHDLGGDDTARPVMLWMIENDVWPDHIHVHTANPVGRDWIVGMAERYAPDRTTITK